MEEVEDNEESINMAKTMRENPKSMINHFKNKRKIISNNIFKYKKDISSELKEYKTKSDFNITMYKKHKDKTEGFKNDYSKIIPLFKYLTRIYFYTLLYLIYQVGFQILIWKDIHKILII